MGTLKEDIKSQAEWITKAFAADGHKLDYSMKSIKEIDMFFENNMVNDKPKQGGRLDKQGFGSILFSIGSYVGETVVRNIKGSEWITDDKDPEGELNVSIRLPDGTTMWPVQRAMKRFKNGEEDSIYQYVLFGTKKYSNSENNLNIDQEKKKPWWKK